MIGFVEQLNLKELRLGALLVHRVYDSRGFFIITGKEQPSPTFNVESYTLYSIEHQSFGNYWTLDQIKEHMIVLTND